MDKKFTEMDKEKLQEILETYHRCRLDCDDEEYLRVRDAIKEFVCKVHRVEEGGRVELKVENKED